MWSKVLLLAASCLSPLSGSDTPKACTKVASDLELGDSFLSCALYPNMAEKMSKNQKSNFLDGPIENNLSKNVLALQKP